MSALVKILVLGVLLIGLTAAVYGGEQGKAHAGKAKTACVHKADACHGAARGKAARGGSKRGRKALKSQAAGKHQGQRQGGRGARGCRA